MVKKWFLTMVKKWLFRRSPKLQDHEHDLRTQEIKDSLMRAKTCLGAWVLTGHPVCIWRANLHVMMALQKMEQIHKFHKWNPALHLKNPPQLRQAIEDAEKLLESF